MTVTNETKNAQRSCLQPVSFAGNWSSSKFTHNVPSQSHVGSIAGQNSQQMIPDEGQAPTRTTATMRTPTRLSPPSRFRAQKAYRQPIVVLSQLPSPGRVAEHILLRGCQKSSWGGIGLGIGGLDSRTVAAGSPATCSVVFIRFRSARNIWAQQGLRQSG